MEPRLRERIDGWETRSLTGGIGNLAEGVSGAVVADEGHLFVHEGRIVGGEGDPERVARTGRLHVAPAPALALGYAMTEREPEARRSYDAAETPPGALHDVLAADERTCYVDPAGGPEPRGEWAIVYEDGAREAAAVGSGEPLTGEEAVDHVSRALAGYEVVEVPLDPVDPAARGEADGPSRGGDDPDAGDRIGRIEARLESIEGEEGLVAENRELRETVDRLEARIEELEAEPEGNAGATAGPEIGADEAIAGTNLFVRYASKGEPTLADLGSREVDPDAVRSNLHLDHHTEFEEGATVEGRPFEAFLETTIEYRFVDWLVGTLPVEIRATGSEEELADLQEAIPRIDRVEFDATLALDDGETVTFDAVAFDKHGTALVTARVHDAREPATCEVVAGLEEATSHATSTYPGIAAAMVVAASYFDPEALEVVEGVTGGGGFLRRNSKRSYVTLSRSRGYHLALVEARREDLYLSVPDL